jgi:ABC-type multidrug transport system permease subunit
MKEFGLLYRRYSKIEFRDVRGNIEMLLQFIILAVVLGLIYFQLTTENFGGFQSRVGLMNFIQGYLFVLSTEICSSWESYSIMLARERSSNTYRLSSAYFAKFLSQLPIRVFSVLCFGTIVYYLAGLRTDTFTAYLIYIAILICTYICSVCLGIVVSTTSVSPLPIFIIFAGYLVNTKSITPIVSWIRFVSPMFYALQALIQNESNGLIIAGQPADVYVANYALNQIPVFWCIGALLFFAVGFFAVGLLGVNKVTKRRYIVI